MVAFSDLVRTPGSGNIYVAGLIDEWHFRQGYEVTVLLQGNPGDTSEFGGQLWNATGAASAFIQAAAAWSAVANISIRVLPRAFDGSGSRDGATWVEQLGPLPDEPNTLGYHFTPGTNDLGGFFNNAHPTFTAASLVRGGYAFLTILHEIGHGLGLSHPFDGPATFPGVGDDPFNFGEGGLNQGMWTVMSYNDGLEGRYPPGFGYGWSGAPMAFDIAAIQHLYGANMATGAGDDVYVLPGANGAGTYWSAIWDAGGIDVLSAQGQAAGVVIDLRAATLERGEGAAGWLSVANGIFGGFTIANGVTIENAIGGNSDDRITGNAAANVLDGGAGNDVLIGGGGRDTFIGGAGDDSFYVDDTAELVFELANGGMDDVFTLVSFYLYDHLERMTLLEEGAADFGVGNALNNLIIGNGRDNLLLGGAGDDSLEGLLGNDALFGEAGDDWLAGGEGSDTLVGGMGRDLLFGGNGSDAIYGQDGNDVMRGGDDFATDILVGGAGDDSLDGASGLGDYDLMDGGAGNDLYRVDTPADLTFEAAGGGIDTVQADITGAGYYLYDHVENLVLEGATPFGVGNALANRITGSGSANWLLGGAGDDVLDGGGGNDVLFGEAGADRFVFTRGTGGDVIGDFQAGTDRIDLSAFGFASFAAVQAAMGENGGTAFINLGNGDFIVLNGVAMTALGAGDFILSGGAAAAIAPQHVDAGWLA
ncbi:M10 family metallopeptidase [Sphingomonas sp. CJ99]